jgi:HAD superfamily hydrolase (TIGR01509 family)
MTALQAIILDFDGVIANNEPLHFEAFRQTLAEQNIKLNKKDYYDRYLGYDDHGFALALAQDLGARIDQTWINDFVTRKGERLQALLDAKAVLFPGAAEFIRTAAGTVPMAIASGAQRHEINQILKVTDLDRHFTTIVSAGDTTESKPSPAPYRLAFEQLRKETALDLTLDRTVAIEDSQWGLESARAAGLRCVGVTTSYTASMLLGAELIAPSLDRLTLETLDQLCTSPRN